MTNNKSYFVEEQNRVASLLEEKKKGAALTFALVTDSHLDDFEEEAWENIRQVDTRVGFDFVGHMGDFLNGSFPPAVTRSVLKEEMDGYRGATRKGVFYPTQGNHDGFTDLFSNQSHNDVALDEDWHEATRFVDDYPGVVRKGDAPYYYVDYSEMKIRLVILCSFSYQLDREADRYRKLYEMSTEQLIWLRDEALALEADWTVLFFSHDGPYKYFDEALLTEEPDVSRRKELLEVVHGAKAERGFSIAAWLIGHWHGELCEKVQGINYVIVGSQTCYVPQLWPMPEKGYYSPRTPGTVRQDLWYGVSLHPEERTLYFYHFGAGDDHVVTY